MQEGGRASRRIMSCAGDRTSLPPCFAVPSLCSFSVRRRGGSSSSGCARIARRAASASVARRSAHRSHRGRRRSRSSVRRWAPPRTFSSSKAEGPWQLRRSEMILSCQVTSSERACHSSRRTNGIPRDANTARTNVAHVKPRPSRTSQEPSAENATAPRYRRPYAMLGARFGRPERRP
jgi:hypothetical protein